MNYFGTIQSNYIKYQKNTYNFSFPDVDLGWISFAVTPAGCAWLPSDVDVFESGSENIGTMTTLPNKKKQKQPVFTAQ